MREAISVVKRLKSSTRMRRAATIQRVGAESLGLTFCSQSLTAEGNR
jgi:hypothetical protein